MNQQNEPQIDPDLLKMMATAQSQQSANSYSVPTMLVDLPSRGLLYSENHPLYKKETIEVRFMTTKEEDILLNTSYIEKGVVLDRLLESVLLDKRVKIDSLLNGDKAAIQIACRVNAYGEEYEFEYICEACNTKNKSSIDLSQLKHHNIDFKKIEKEGGIFITLPISKKVIKAKILTGVDDEEVRKRLEQKKRHGMPEQPLIERYRQIFVSIDGDEDPMRVASFAQNMSIKDSRYFMKNYIKMLPSVDFTYNHVCENCATDNKGGVPVGASFFYPNE